MPSPDRLVVVAGTGTEVGKTWWTCAVASALRGEGVRVAARKPVQSFDPSDPPETHDAALLAAATGDRPEAVCPSHRSYPVEMAPPMAADVLGRPAIKLGDLVNELRWPAGTEVGFVETAGGLRSPIAHDGDGLDLVSALDPEIVVLVAGAGLGTLNVVRLCLSALASRPAIVILNRYDATDELHRRNRTWLIQHDAVDVVVDPASLAALLSPVSALP